MVIGLFGTRRGGVQFDNPYGDCELAWTNFEKKSVKKYIVISQGFITKEKDRYHPTQKPVALMSRIIKDYTEFIQTIIDPFMGSGTTLVAAKLLGRNAVGIEISPEYCKIAKDRLRQEVLF